jgi:DNA repair protein RecO (recombination protein O)
MIESATGIILRTRRFTETSLIVHWLTAKLGRLSTVAKGACRPKSPLRGRLDLFYEAEFSFVRSRRSDLHTLREVSLRETHAALREDLAQLRPAAYAVALIEQATEQDSPIPSIYELLTGFLRSLPAAPPRPQQVLAFEFKLLAELGLQPDIGRSRLTLGAKRIVTALATDDWPSVRRLGLSRPQVSELSQFLDGFLLFHLGKIPANRRQALGA